MVITREFAVNTRGNCDISEVTHLVSQAVGDSGVANGTVTIFIPGSTAGVTTVEYEPGLVADLEAAFERLAPRGIGYRHDARWGDGNGHAHVRASLLGPSLVIPFASGKLILGAWQQIVVIDFDNRPRRRQVVLQIMGE
ncbi:MAG: YjbQ family protein [Chloroflexi bacterium]|nr:YjbQ family protein [Chloroflexota bacterium]